jgi:DNA-binding transcriptional ArsR family regulator
MFASGCGEFQKMPASSGRNHAEAAEPITLAAVKVLEGYDCMSHIDDVLKALCEPTRRRIVEKLTAGPQPVSQLADRLDASLSTTVQHLAVLESTGLVHTVKRGRVRICRLNIKALSRVENWFTQRRLRLERSFDRLEGYLERREDLDG